MVTAGVVNFPFDENDETQDESTIQDFISKWKKYAKDVKNFLGFRKAAKHIKPISPGTDPRQAALALSKIAGTLAKKYKSSSLRKLSVQLQTASKDISSARKVLTELSGPEVDRPVLKRSRKVADFTVEAENSVKAKAKDYIYQLIRRNSFNKEQIKSLSNDNKSLGVFKEYLENSGYNLSPSGVQKLWSDTINEIVGEEKNARVSALRNYFSGEDSVGIESVSELGNDSTFTRMLSASTASDDTTAPSDSKSTLLKIAGEIIEFYAAEKNPNKITEEDLIDYLEQERPAYLKHQDSILKLLFELTHRKVRHEAKKAALEAEIVPLAKWLADNIDGLVPARALLWARKIAPWVQAAEFVAPSKIVKQVADITQKSTQQLKKELREVVAPMESAPIPASPDEDTVSKVMSCLLRAKRCSGKRTSSVFPLETARRFACGSNADRIVVIKNILSEADNVKIANTMINNIRTALALLMSPVEAKSLVKAASDSIAVSTSIPTAAEYDSTVLSSIPPKHSCGCVEIGGVKVGESQEEETQPSWQEPPEGVRFGEELE